MTLGHTELCGVHHSPYRTGNELPASRLTLSMNDASVTDGDASSFVHHVG